MTVDLACLLIQTGSDESNLGERCFRMRSIDSGWSVSGTTVCSTIVGGD